MEDHFMNEALAITNLSLDFPAKEEGGIISILQVFRYYILHLECKSPSHLIRNHLWTRIVEPFSFICPQFQLLFRLIHLQKKNWPPQLLQLKEILPSFLLANQLCSSAHGELGRPSDEGTHKRAKNSAGSSTAATTSLVAIKNSSRGKKQGTIWLVFERCFILHLF